MDYALGILVHLADLVHSISKGAAGSQIGKDNITRIREKQSANWYRSRALLRDVEFHHKNPGSPNNTADFSTNAALPGVRPSPVRLMLLV